MKTVWKYHDLLLFVNRYFILQYKHTILGPSWAIIQPLLTMVIFTVVLGSLASLAASGAPAYYLLGSIAWNYFASCLIKTANTFNGNAGILGKVYFPHLVIYIHSLNQFNIFRNPVYHIYCFLIFLNNTWSSSS